MADSGSTEGMNLGAGGGLEPGGGGFQWSRHSDSFLHRRGKARGKAGQVHFRTAASGLNRTTLRPSAHGRNRTCPASLPKGNGTVGFFDNPDVTLPEGADSLTFKSDDYLICDGAVRYHLHWERSSDLNGKGQYAGFSGGPAGHFPNDDLPNLYGAYKKPNGQPYKFRNPVYKAF
jgi:hypothetical protein